MAIARLHEVPSCRVLTIDNGHEAGVVLHVRGVITDALARDGFRCFFREMGRSDLERLSREELIEPVLRPQRPDKTSRTSSKPPVTDREEQREHSKPGGAKPGHEVTAGC